MRFLAYLLISLSFVSGISLADTSIPPELEGWRGWVLDSHKDINCPILYNKDQKNCIWPTELSIQVAQKSGKFVQTLEVFSDAWVSLPGNKDYWPSGIINLPDNRSLTIRDKDGKPEVFLTLGKYQIQGDWTWDKTPRTLTVPETFGIISLVIEGKTINSPFMESQNQLLLNASNQKANVEHLDSLQIRVFRHIQDNVPLKMISRIELDVSGKERELHLGQALLENFRITGFESDLPAKLEKDGSLRVQARSGSWTIQIQSRSVKSLTQIPFVKLHEQRDWPNQEVWVVEQQPTIRNIQISGMPPIDPQQTQLPDEWRTLPAYLAEPDTALKLEELQRGGESAKNQLELSRQMWLDFSGKGYTLKDEIRGELHQGWRLDTQKPYALQSANLEGEALLITQLSPDANAGVEIRQRELNLEGISRVENLSAIPISGWSSVFNRVSTELILPPGWSLITATGTSYETGSWWEKWTLWTFFLVLIISVALAKIIRPWVGALALTCLIIIYHRADSPTLIWLNLAAVLAILPYISGKFKTWIKNYGYLSFLLLGLFLLPFCVQQAREFFYPQQEYAGKNMRDQYYSEDSFSDNFIVGASKKPMMKSATSMQDDRLEEIVVTGIKASQKQQIYAPNQIVQAGPGIPDWHWNSVQVTWNGPVLPDETTRLFLVSPFWNRIGSLLSLLLPLILGGVLLHHFISVIKEPTETSSPNLSSANLSGILLLVLIPLMSIITPNNAHADAIIDKKLLQELEKRLTVPAECLPNCASIESVQLKAELNQLALKMKVHALEKIAFPLPSQSQVWWPYSILVDGKNASLLQTSQGQLMVYLAKGTHDVQMLSNLQNRDELDINFGITAHNFGSQLSGWQLSGNTQGTISSVQLQRNTNEKEKNRSTEEQLRPDPIPPFVLIKRQLHFDLEWSLYTEVYRMAPTEGVINLDVPLLEGESPLDGNTNLQNFSADKRKLQIQFDKQEQLIHWNSRLSFSDKIQLTAAEGQPWVEIWELNSSPVWHVESDGIASIQPTDINQPQTWQPWPGETINLSLSRPQAVGGNSLVIESVDYNLSPAARATTSTLDLSIRTNQANQFEFTLPENSSLDQVLLDNNRLPLNPVNGVLRIPLLPGEQDISISWQSTIGISTLVKSPNLNLGLPTANQSININLSNDRWTLLVGGPSIGPSVLLWGMLLVILIIATQLGRHKLTPLSTRQWLLLSLGVATVNLYILVLIACWFMVLQWRQNLGHISSKSRFKWMQFGLFCLSILSLLALLGAIPYSLLSSPDMHIQGNGSSANYLRWYQDMSTGELAQAWVISLPMWSYQLVMLAWSLWLASALTGWLAWAWKALGTGGFWYASDELINTTTKNA